MLHPVKPLALSLGIVIALSSQYVFAGTTAIPLTASNSASASSWVAGAHAGYNWQRGAFVYGLEADISATNLKTDLNTVIQSPITTANANASVDWYGTLRGRLGWAQGPAMFYGTGGLAYGNVDLHSGIFTNGLSLSSDASSVKVGWVLGGGIEYMWQPNLILNLGYQYVDLGTVGLASSTTLLNQTLSQSASANGRFSVVTVGLSWLFSPADKAPHGAWEGAYIGGHVGGAWGNDTNANYSANQVFFSDTRLKREIALIGRRDDGLGLYRYRYLWSDTVYVGVMAQEVALLHPDAIVRDTLDDYLRVDYGRLGLHLMTLREWNALSTSARL